MKFIQVKFERYYYASVDKRIGARIDDERLRRRRSGCRMEKKRSCKKKVDRGEGIYVESETYDGPPQRDCTSRIYRPFGRESVILWTQMRRCLRVGHLSRVSRERKRDRSSLCVPMMPSLQRGPTKSILTPSQIDGPSSRVCLGLAALTYVPTPTRPAYPYFSFLSFPFLPLFAKCYTRENVKILR